MPGSVNNYERLVQQYENRAARAEQLYNSAVQNNRLTANTLRAAQNALQSITQEIDNLVRSLGIEETAFDDPHFTPEQKERAERAEAIFHRIYSNVAHLV